MNNFNTEDIKVTHEQIDDLDIIFPYPKIYPEQKGFMEQTLLSIKQNGVFIIEIPPGSGRCTAFFSVILSYLSQLKHQIPSIIENSKKIPQIIYCCESLATIHEANLSLEDVIRARKSVNSDYDFKSIVIGSQNQYCLDESVISSSNPCSSCQSKTLPWCQPEQRCQYFHDIEDTPIPSGISTISSLREFGKMNNKCPYHLAYHFLESADIVFCSTYDFLDPKKHYFLLNRISEDAIITFDNMSTIDEVCSRVFSFTFNEEFVKQINKSQKELIQLIDKKFKLSDLSSFNSYKIFLSDGITIDKLESEFPPYTSILMHPTCLLDRPNRNIPGSFRVFSTYPIHLKHLVEYIKNLFGPKVVEFAYKSPSEFSNYFHNFLTEIQDSIYLDSEYLYFMKIHTSMFLKILNITNLDTYSPLLSLLDFLSIISYFEKGFQVDMNYENPNIQDDPSSNDHKNTHFFLTLTCYDSSIAFRPVLEKFHRIGLIGSSVPFLQFYKYLLNIPDESLITCLSIPAKDFEGHGPDSMMNICPIIVSHGNDQKSLTTEGSTTATFSNLAYMRSAAGLFMSLSSVVPGGIVVFFQSLQLMHKMIPMWCVSGIIFNMFEKVPIFIEQEDPGKTYIAYRNFCDSVAIGRGGMLFALYNGRLVHQNLIGHYARCVVCMGYPDVTQKLALDERVRVLAERKSGLSKQDYITFDALRYAFLPFENVVADKSDPTVLILSDLQFEDALKNFFERFPSWFIKYLRPNSQKEAIQSNENKSPEEASEIAKKFFTASAQPNQ